MTDNKGKKEYTLMEGNLLEYPIFSMQKRRQDKIVEEYVWQEKDMAGRVIIERKFKVDCVQGVPNFFDMDVFNGIMRLYVKKGGNYKKNEAHFTIYELVKELDLPVHDGRTINRVRESIERMVKTCLSFENAFYIEKEKITKILHLIAGVEIYDKEKGGRLINVIKVVLDDTLVNSIEKKYYKLIDFKIYKTLNSGIPRRLYEYLEKKKYGKNQFEIEIKKLAKWLGLKTSKISQLKELFEKANNELKEKGVIDDWQYHKGNIVFCFRKSESFKDVENDLFYIENLVVTFYKSLGQEKTSEILRQEGMVLLQDLIDEGYSKEDVAYALSWAVDNVKGIYSIQVLPKVIGQALGDRDGKELIEKKREADHQKKIEEVEQIEEDRKKAAELDKVFAGLSKEEQEKIEKQAKANLIEQGLNPRFILPIVLRAERNKMLKEEKKADGGN